ncbi:hypothetical protein ACIRBZ_46710 [Streptomyces sp. NPDC094038]|uniref:hypothetical protein n=1 Tax=Streptomyces sp. NPDC094038 TaxID=3366055 RepID=UPI003825702C
MKQESPDGQRDGATDFVAWGKENERMHPTHTRFRLVLSTNFQILPARVEPIPPIP